MRYALAVAVLAILGFAVPASAEDADVGVHVGPVGAGVSVDSGREHRDSDHTTIVKEREPRDKTVIIKKEREREPDKVIIDKE